MLTQLYIENIAVIEKAEIDFSKGFTVLTGETGAGKSIVIDAINAVLGERTSRDIIRTGQSSAFVSALFFDIDPLIASKIEEEGFEIESDGSLLIQRTIKQDSKGSVKINGRPAAVSVLREIGSMLINIHGQHDNQALLNVRNHLYYLDMLAGDDEELRAYQDSFHKYEQLEKELSELFVDENMKNSRIETLKAQIEEILKADLKEGEYKELCTRRDYLVNAEKISRCIESAHNALSGSEDISGAVSLLHIAAKSLGEAALIFPGISHVFDKCNEIIFAAEDVSEEIRAYISREDYSVDEINDLEERIYLIQSLMKKYGESETKILSCLDNAQNELEMYQNTDELIAQKKSEVSKALECAENMALKLSQKRKEAVKIFAGKVRAELTFLDMPQVRLAVSFRKTPLSPTGFDAVEFLISANPGEEPKSIAKIASGGELSRIMLAIKNVLAEKDDIDTLIFDEIDTGISGKAAAKVGRKLHEAANSRQVISVTHLAQIAACADSQLLIEKKIQDGKTFTCITPLDQEGRIKEIARIIGGETITEATLLSAKEMLDKNGGKNESF